MRRGGSRPGGRRARRSRWPRPSPTSSRPSACTRTTSRRCSEADWTALEELARAPRVVGIGETGLDYYYDHSPREQQQAAYRRFVGDGAGGGAGRRVARARRARGGGRDPRARSAPADGRHPLLLGRRGRGARLPGPRASTCRSRASSPSRTRATLREAAAFAPLDRILIETDAPYLAPIPHRGRKNEPAYIAETLAALAAVRGLPAAEVDAATSGEHAAAVRACRRPRAIRRILESPSVSSTAPVRIRLRFASFDAFIDKFAPNVTRGGVFLASRTPLPDRRDVRVRDPARGRRGRAGGRRQGHLGQGVRSGRAAEAARHGRPVPAPRQPVARAAEQDPRAQGRAGAVRAPARAPMAAGGSGAHRLGTNGRARTRRSTPTSIWRRSSASTRRACGAPSTATGWAGQAAGEIDELEKLLKPEPVEPVSIAQALAELPRLLSDAARAPAHERRLPPDSAATRQPRAPTPDARERERPRPRPSARRQTRRRRREMVPGREAEVQRAGCVPRL